MAGLMMSIPTPDQKLIMNFIRKYKQMDAEMKRKKFAINYW